MDGLHLSQHCMNGTRESNQIRCLLCCYSADGGVGRVKTSFLIWKKSCLLNRIELT